MSMLRHHCCFNYFLGPAVDFGVLASPPWALPPTIVFCLIDAAASGAQPSNLVLFVQGKRYHHDALSCQRDQLESLLFDNHRNLLIVFND